MIPVNNFEDRKDCLKMEIGNNYKYLYIYI